MKVTLWGNTYLLDSESLVDFNSESRTSLGDGERETRTYPFCNTSSEHLCLVCWSTRQKIIDCLSCGMDFFVCHCCCDWVSVDNLIPLPREVFADHYYPLIQFALWPDRIPLRKKTRSISTFAGISWTLSLTCFVCPFAQRQLKHGEEMVKVYHWAIVPG